MTQLGRFKVTTGVVETPLRDVVYGVSGVGKTTFAAEAPTPIFLGERGSLQLNVSRFDPVTDWASLVGPIETLAVEPHGYKTLVLDTLDHVEESAVWPETVKRYGKPKWSITSFGYGKGYEFAVEVWRDLLRRLEALQAKTGMNLLLLAHAKDETYKNPTGADYARYQLKIHKFASARITGWADSLLFASYDVQVDKDSPKALAGDRYLYTQRLPAAEAKSRHGLPPRIELAWHEFARLLARPPEQKLADLRRSVAACIAQIAAGDSRARAEQALAGAKTLADVRRVQTKVEERLRLEDEQAQGLAQDEREPGPGPAPEENDPPQSTPAAPASTGGVSPAPAVSPPGGVAAPRNAETPAVSSGGGAAPAPARGPSHEEATFPAEPAWTKWKLEDVLARIGPAQHAHAEAIFQAFANPKEEVRSSIAIFNLLSHANGNEVAAWWRQAGGRIEKASGKGRTEILPQLLTGEQLGTVLTLAPKIFAVGASS